MSDRRTFLKRLAAASAAMVLASRLPRGWAYDTPAVPGRLIVIFQRGGLDGLYALSPVDDPQLAELRPTLSNTVLDKGIRLAGTGFAAHPGCAKLAELFSSADLAFAPCAGTVDRSRSHFQAQDLFELGTGNIRGESGFMARAAGELDGSGNAISFTPEVPLAFQGTAAPPEVAPFSGSGLKLPRGRVLEAIRRAHRGQKTGEELEQAIATETEIVSTTGMEVAAARGAPGVNKFPKLAEQMGRMLAGNPRLGLAFIDLGGFDTHVAEDGILSRSLENFASGLASLKDSLGPGEWRRTRVVVMTEFGRTVRENGTRGSDHGHGGLALVAGAALAGPHMVGDFPGLTESRLNERRDLPVLVDWRDLIGESMHTVFGFGAARLDRIFPGRPGVKVHV
jgi:uncharacterized protein (DUF1501 family)